MQRSVVSAELLGRPPIVELLRRAAQEYRFHLFLLPFLVWAPAAAPPLQGYKLYNKSDRVWVNYSLRDEQCNLSVIRNMIWFPQYASNMYARCSPLGHCSESRKDVEGRS
ncbi:hypothetical protein ZEAMMB73_Zm00001d010765 [Zea mays]|uniref:Uncharacterized protein n=1 Tax=Zea mays TaxID=4577 RepID=A0A1D6FTI4_MAIZE|nr:hypothetical protein ZEAMMB73_Zm00001d010765 [Zea mays]